MVFLTNFAVLCLQIQLPSSGLEDSSSDSSDLSSEEDSTVVHMKTRSRSPSPHKGKHRHRRGDLCSHSVSPAPVKEEERGETDASHTSGTAESTGRPAEDSSCQMDPTALAEKATKTEDSGE